MKLSEKIALYPGSFDPFTIAHEEIVQTALTIFDKVVVAIGYNPQKDGFLPIEKRKDIIIQTFKDNNRVEVVDYTSLTVELCRTLEIKHIVRGVRNYADFEMEKNLAEVNKILAPEITTIFLTTPPELSAISSSAVREIVKFGADPSHFLPKGAKIE